MPRSTRTLYVFSHTGRESRRPMLFPIRRLGLITARLGSGDLLELESNNTVERGPMAITAQAIVERIKQKLGSGWKDKSVDSFLAGDRKGEVKGIVTTFAPSLEVLRKAVAGGKNLIISRESPYWARPACGLRSRRGGVRSTDRTTIPSTA